jgi:putative aldouronate transport system permease protein
MVYSTSDIIDTWVYRIGLIGMNYSIGTCAGLFKSGISMVMIIVSYMLAKKFADYKIF